MTTYKRVFAPLIYVGGAALALALGTSMAATGTLICQQPFLCALRRLALSTLASGLTFWIAGCRTCGEKPQLNPLFNILAPAGLIASALGLIVYASPPGPAISFAGLALAGSALAVGVFADIFDPAHPCPVSQSWPEGGEAIPNPWVPAIENLRPHGHPIPPQDLTRLEGIGPRIQSVLYEAGITSYLDVSVASPQRIRMILDEYHIHAPYDPTSWPLQAKLADRNCWDELATLQAHLDHGRYSPST